MRVVFLCREGLPARFIGHRLHEEGLLHAVVSEVGGAAKKRKLRRTLDRTPWWALPGLGRDLLALSAYGRRWRRYLAGRLADHPAAEGWPDVPRSRFDDANDPTCVLALEALQPDVLVVYGTSILGPDVLQTSPTALNIHGGIVPAYRNVHSEVWAVLNGDAENVGTSILHLDEGIDSGAVALQRRVSDADSFSDLRWKNLELSADLIVEALRKHAAGTLPAERQAEGEPGFYPTPGARELRRLSRLRRME